jgi:hypothetical protein
MKLSKNSTKLISFLLDTKHNKNTKLTTKTENILKLIYYDIMESYVYLKKKPGMYHMETKKINNAYEIPKPNNFSYKSFPEQVRKHIDENIVSQLTYTFSLFERNIKIHFIEEKESIAYNKHMDMIFMWLYILNKHASKTCSNRLVVYLYFTSLEKKIPSNISILDEIHINSAFTSTCPKDSEIVIFRKEEWLKVFIHETFHNFGLDFSDMDGEICKAKILEIFPVDSDVNLYESYTEVWAEIMNACFCSFSFLKKPDEEMFMQGVEMFCSLERKYSFIQMVKTLQFMGLTYKDLYSEKRESQMLRTLYKEKTNVLSYYVIKCIIMNDYQRFLSWCQINNSSLFQFKKTNKQLLEYCKFIERSYKSRMMLEEVNDSELFLRRIENEDNKDKYDSYYLLTNMRMSICELG